VRILVIAAAAASLVTLSCASVVRVSHLETAKVAAKGDDAGLPFYIKVERFKPTSVYRKTWLRLTMTVEHKGTDTKTGKAVTAGNEKAIYQKDVLRDSPQLAALKAAMVRSSGTEVEALALINQFKSLPAIANDDSVTPVLVKNTVQSVWVVDSAHTYYLNAPFPWFGSGNLTQELNPDGTLSKVTSNPESKVAEGISALLPIKEFLTGEFVKSGTASDTAPASANSKLMMMLRSVRPAIQPTDAVFVYEISLDITEMGHEYTLESALLLAQPATYPPIAFSKIQSNEATFTMTDVGAADKDKKDDGQKIGISGTINFPKNWGAAKSDDKK
jgi:hypothetical protein